MSGKLGPYQLNSIVHGDCLEVMPGLPDRSVDMILSDWPYAETQNSWDSLIPLEPLWEQVKRVIKPGGAIVMTATQPFASMVIMANLKWFKWEDVWEKSHATGHLNCKVMPLRQHEDILVFGQGRITYNPQIERKPAENVRPPTRGNDNLGDGSNAYGKFNRISERTVSLNESYPRSVFKINTVNHGEKGLHPTQKPIALFSYLIRTYSNPGDLILDNCAGSCTTAIAAIDTGRNWLCIEKYPLPGQPISKTNPDYVGIGRERVRERLAQPFLPGVIETALPQPVQLDLGVSDG